MSSEHTQHWYRTTDRIIRNSYQEDSHQFAALSLDPEELRLDAQKNFDVDWDPSAAGEAFARQVLYVGIFDGYETVSAIANISYMANGINLRHGGPAVSMFLHQNLHGLFESVEKSQIPDLCAWTKEHGGYFKRWRGGALAPWFSDPVSTEAMDLEARATMAFLEADRIMTGHEAQTCGATASVALLHSLDIPSTPFYAAKRVALTVAHCGCVWFPPLLCYFRLIRIVEILVFCSVQQMAEPYIE